MSDRRTGSLLRNHGGGHAAVSYLELFFDLVYVFAITQLSHFLLDHLSATGAMQTVILFLAVWWAWMYTTWATNWINPERGPVRLVIVAVMLGSLVLSSAMPHAFGPGGLVFALAYCAIQIGRTAFVAWSMRHEDVANSRNLTRATIWFLIAAPLWIAGPLVGRVETQMAMWTAALAIEYVGPALRFFVPGLSRSDTTDWVISGAHMAERCALFIIIALGEGIIVTGTEFASRPPDNGSVLAFLTAFLGSVAMWWVYFDLGAKRGAEHIEHHEDPGRVARSAFTYWHLPIVAGLVVTAVADEMTLAHPFEPAHANFIAVTATGIALFVGGTMVFKRLTSGNPWFPLSHLVGLGLLAAMTLWGILAHPSHLALAAAVVAILVIVALWEWGSLHGGWVERIERAHPNLGARMRRRGEAHITKRAGRKY